MKGHYKDKLEKCACWRSFKTCLLGKEFLETLYSWSEDNPIHPYLAWKIYDPCEYENKTPDNWKQYA
jgi:hypothetical protein